jgi:hypothetical protein
MLCKGSAELIARSRKDGKIENSGTRLIIFILSSLFEIKIKLQTFIAIFL